MKLPCKICVWLLPFFLTACIHKQQAKVQPLAPPIVDNPPPPPSTADPNLPPRVATIPTQPTVAAPTPPKPQPRHHKTPRNTQQPPASVQEASNPAPNPGVSAIGQLSSGDGSNYRQTTSELIETTERGLNSITRPLGDNEQKIAAQIRDFLKQARVALVSGDADGAHTLAAKAAVLLKELTP
jgi:outer membrane biosynthesis protein TonB